MTNDVGRNDPCPCGSGTKYKNCFGMNLMTCSEYVAVYRSELEKSHSEKDKLVFQFFTDTLEDIGAIFAKSDKGHELIASRVQLIALFTLVDVLASYWYEYRNRIGTGTPRDRFASWLSEFCYVPENKEFIGSEYEKISIDRLYELRSSLVHFFGLARTAVDTFGIAPNDDEARSTMLSFIKQQKNKGTRMYLIESKKLHSLISEGALLMLGRWSKIIKDSQTDETKKWSHIEGIDRIYTKVMNEGAVRVRYK